MTAFMVKFGMFWCFVFIMAIYSSIEKPEGME